MGMGMGMGFGATPPELGFRPLTLQYELGPNCPPSFPVDMLPSSKWKDRVGPWDPDVLSLLYLDEFMQTNWRNIGLPGRLFGWQPNKPGFEKFVKSEIVHLQQLMQIDRERYLGEIVVQHDGAPAYWVSLLAVNGHQHSRTLVVMNLAVRIGQVVAAYYKKKYRRPRPSYVCPGLLPPFGPPAHASFPSGHSLQSWLMSLFLEKAVPAYKKELYWLAERVAFNRERAGVHYPSDTEAGKALAEACLELIKADCRNIRKLFAEAADEWTRSITPPTNDAPPKIP
jgi:membrane-associated phospholipid phosphatase